MAAIADPHTTTGKAVIASSGRRTVAIQPHENPNPASEQNPSSSASTKYKIAVASVNKDPISRGPARNTNSPNTRPGIVAVDRVEDLLVARASFEYRCSHKVRIDDVSRNNPRVSTAPRIANSVDKESRRIPVAPRKSSRNSPERTGKNGRKGPATTASPRDPPAVRTIRRYNRKGTARRGTIANVHYTTVDTSGPDKRGPEYPGRNRCTGRHKGKGRIYANTNYIVVSRNIVDRNSPVAKNCPNSLSSPYGAGRYNRSRGRVLVASRKCVPESPNLVRNGPNWERSIDNIRRRNDHTAPANIESTRGKIVYPSSSPTVARAIGTRTVRTHDNSSSCIAPKAPPSNTHSAGSHKASRKDSCIAVNSAVANECKAPPSRARRPDLGINLAGRKVSRGSD